MLQSCSFAGLCPDPGATLDNVTLPLHFQQTILPIRPKLPAVVATALRQAYAVQKRQPLYFLIDTGLGAPTGDPSRVAVVGNTVVKFAFDASVDFRPARA